MSVAPKGNRNEKDFVLSYIRLYPQDPSATPDRQGYFEMKNHFVEFTFEESLFEPGIHGNIFFADAIDYPTLLPFIGEERISISFTRADETSRAGELLPPIEFNLPIYSFDGQNQDGDSRKRQSYTLYYCSDASFKNLNAVVYQTYQNKRYSDMVQKLYDDFLKVDDKQIFIEPTAGDRRYVIQKMSPIKAIKNLTKLSVSDTLGNGSMYVFYEDRDRFNFVTLSYLAKQAPVATYTYHPKNISKSLSSQTDLKIALYNADRIEHKKGFDLFSSALSGEASGSMLSLDPLRRKFSLKAFDLRGEAGKAVHGMELLPNSSWDEFSHVEKSKMWKDTSKMFIDPRVNMSVKITDNGQDTNEYIKEREPNVLPRNPEEFLLQRKSQKQQFMKHVLATTVSGDPRIKAGVTIQFKIPETLGKVGKKNAEELDKYLQGKYLVLSVAHVINKRQYIMNLELIRDSVFSDIEARNPVEEYKNIL